MSLHAEAARLAVMDARADERDAAYHTEAAAEHPPGPWRSRSCTTALAYAEASRGAWVCALERLLLWVGES